ncbi:alpha/beta hydrolase, partial [Variovorax sp. HJSM1_2]
MNTLNMPTRRRSFLGSAALSLAVAPIGSLLGAQARAASPDGATRFALLKTVNAGDLGVEYAEAGPAQGPVAILLHGWP